MHQTRLQVKRKRENANWNLSENKMRFKRKRKITNAKIYEDKHDLYCNFWIFFPFDPDHEMGENILYWLGVAYL